MASAASLAFALCSPTIAFAQAPGGGPPATTPEQDKARLHARELVNEGLTLMEKKKFDEACDRFERAESLFHAPTNLRYLAQALVAVGKLAKAKAVYERVAKEELPFYAPDVFKQAREQSIKELAELAPRVPSIAISVPPRATDVEVLVDDVKLANDALGKPYSIDPGEHRIVGRGATGRDVVRKVKVEEAQHLRVELPIEVASDDVKPVPTGGRPAGSIAPAAIAFGVGGVGLVLGGITGAIALGKASAVKERCTDGRCPSAAEPDAESAKSIGTISTVGFVVGGLGVTAGIVLLAVRRKAEPGPTVGLRIGPQRLGVVGTF